MINGNCSEQPEALAAEGVRKRRFSRQRAILHAEHRPLRICSGRVLNRYDQCIMNVLGKETGYMKNNKVKRFIGCCACFVFAIVCSAFAVCGASEEELIYSVEKQSGEPVFKYWCDDFDYDGNMELFAAVGKDAMGTSLWFSSEKETVNFPILGYVYCGEWDSPEGICSINSQQKLFVAETGAGGSGSSSVCYYVKDGIAIPAPKSGENLRQEAGAEFTINPSAFDDWGIDGFGSGHTYKKYYLHWNGTEFTEYEGREISRGDLEKYAGGADAIMQAESEGFSIGSIFERDNGIINVNLFKEGSASEGDGGLDRDNENMTLEVKNGEVFLVVINHNAQDWIGKYSYGGIYESVGLLW